MPGWAVPAQGLLAASMMLNTHTWTVVWDTILCSCRPGALS